MPFFSIIIPTYNRAHLLGKALRSVQEQSFSDWECIVVDDGSTDKTKELVGKYTETDKRFKYIFQQNAERSAARNKGISYSNGQYICFLDSDDYYLENRLELLHGFLLNINLPIGFFYTGFFIEKNKQLEAGLSFSSHNNVFDQIIFSLILCQRVCISRDILIKNQFNPGLIVGEDVELWIRIAVQHPPVFIPNQSTFVLVDHSERTVARANYIRFKFQLESLKVIFSKGHPGFKNITKKVRKSIFSYVYFGLGKYYLSEGKRFLGVLLLIRAIFSDLKNTQIRHRIFSFSQFLKWGETPLKTLNRIENGK